MQNRGISPQNKGSKPRSGPGLSTVGSPLPQLRGFECKQSGAGSVAKPGLRTPPVGPEPLRGKARWGGGCLPPGSPPDTPSASPLPITLRWGQNSVACSENPPAYGDPTPSSFQGKGGGQPGGWRGAGPEFVHHTCTPGAADRGSRRFSARPGGRAPKREGWFSVSACLPSRTGGRGATLGKSDPTTSAAVQARPKLSVGGGTVAVREPGKYPDRAPDSPRVSHCP